MVTLSELQSKEVVMVHNGKRLGQITDLLIDEQSGLIISIILLEREGKGSLFQKPVEKEIKWQQIKTIGKDIILVEDEIIQQQISSPEK